MFEDQTAEASQFDGPVGRSAKERSLDVALKLCKENVLFLYSGLNLNADALRLITWKVKEQDDQIDDQTNYITHAALASCSLGSNSSTTSPNNVNLRIFGHGHYMSEEGDVSNGEECAVHMMLEHLQQEVEQIVRALPKGPIHEGGMTIRTTHWPPLVLNALPLKGVKMYNGKLRVDDEDE